MNKIKKENFKWTEEKIQDYLRKNFLSSSAKKYELFGKFIFNWESDYIAITRSRYVYECEIKISRNDFFNDKKKVKKHLLLEDNSSLQPKPNYFYYVVPENLILPNEVPDLYGLIYVSTSGHLDIVKKPQKLHDNKINYDDINLIDNLYYTMWNYIDKYRNDNVSELKKQIKKLQRDILKYDDALSDANCQINDLKEELSYLRNTYFD